MELVFVILLLVMIPLFIMIIKFVLLYSLLWAGGLLLIAIMVFLAIFVFTKLMTKSGGWKTWAISIALFFCFLLAFGGNIFKAYRNYFSPSKELAERQKEQVAEQVERQKAHHQTLDDNNWAKPTKIVESSKRKCASNNFPGNSRKEPYLSTFGYKGYSGEVQAAACLCIDNSHCHPDEACIGRERLEIKNGDFTLIASSGRTCVRKGAGFRVQVFDHKNTDKRSLSGYLGEGVVEVDLDGIPKFDSSKFGFD
ncbi:MAG: hypothetical protein V1848_02290 [Candidatus Magasanikbacteria bacterium]